MSLMLKQAAIRGRLRAWRVRTRRLLFPSAEQVELIRIMGGKVVVIDLIKEPKNRRPLCFVTSLGDVLQRNFVSREVRMGIFTLDFGNDIKRGIEVAPRPFHGDIIRDYRRNEYAGRFGWILLHIAPASLYREPEKVRARVRDFLEK